jgi:peptidoglycan/LPS O-acetylase OafA/YrhL
MSTDESSPASRRTAQPLSSSFRPDIEGLRAIAILAVVAYHTGIPGFSGGYVGVDIFFVLSGYLITGLIVGEICRNGKLDFRRFYARRARRLLPALTLTLLATIIAGFAIYPPSEVVHGGFATTAVSAAAYVSNLYFGAWNTDYFAPNRENNPLLHTWSLSVEEQFYLIWPVFVIFGWKILRLQEREKSTRRLLFWMAIAVACSFTLSLYWTTRSRPLAYFASPARAWEFAFGGLAVLLPEEGMVSRILNRFGPARGRRTLEKIAGFSGWIGLLGILLATVVFDKKTPFPGIAVLLPAFSTILVLRTGKAEPVGALVRMLSVGPLQHIGRLSYSWYLWHWPVIVMGSALLSEPSLSLRIGLAAFSLALSAMSYRLVEDPIRKMPRLAGSHGYSLAMAALLAIVGISASIAWKATSSRKAEEPAQLRFNLAYNDFAAELQNDTCIGKLLDATVRTCAFGTDKSSPTIVLFGDSHASQWFPALEPFSTKGGFRLETIVKFGCPPVDAPFVDKSIGRVFTECEEWRRGAIQKIRQIRPLLTVLTYREYYPIRDDAWHSGIDSIVQDLAESSENVLILRDTPQAEIDIPSCLARFAWRSSFIPVPSCEFTFPGTSNVYEFQRSAAAQHNNVHTADLSPSICPNGLCSGIRGDLIVYRDTDHLTASFARSLETDLGREIDRSLGTKFVHPAPIAVSGRTYQP